jgi:uncharacterized RDD family membrane protein YckC
MSTGRSPLGSIDQQNPYATVGYNLPSIEETRSGALPLADRGKRLLAAITDMLFQFACMAPGGIAMIVGIVNAEKDANGDPQFNALMGIGIGLLLIAALLILVLQLYLMATKSQTVGKYFLKLRIDDFLTGERANFVKVFVLRGIVNGVLSAIPFFIGNIYAIVDILFIFREDRRCIHDLIAGTRVVDLSK